VAVAERCRPLDQDFAPSLPRPPAPKGSPMRIAARFMVCFGVEVIDPARAKGLWRMRAGIETDLRGCSEFRRASHLTFQLDLEILAPSDLRGNRAMI
jgi:hypothetical protein